MRTWWLVVSVFAVSLGCGRSPALRPVEPRVIVLDGGWPGAADAGSPAVCALPFSGPDCCGASGARVGSASCAATGYVCAQGEVCTCGGQPATFHCVDVCGGDAYVGAACTGAGWACPQGLLKTSDCPAGTCYGEPGECCLGPRCVEGLWTCEALRSPC